jgi:hypothetical protein
MLPQVTNAAGMDYSAPYCAKPKVHAACTPEGTTAAPPKTLPKGGWPTRSVPFVLDLDAAVDPAAMKNAARMALKDIQSNSDLTFYECSDENALRAYLGDIRDKHSIKAGYIRLSYKVRTCENESMGYTSTSTYLEVLRGGPVTDPIGVSAVTIGGYQCSQLDPMGISHEILHALGFYHNLESPKAAPYFKLTGTADPKFLKVKQLQSQSVAGRAFAQTEFDYFSLVASNLEQGGEIVFAPDTKFKDLAAQIKRKYGIEIRFSANFNGKKPNAGEVITDRYFGQSGCLTAGDAEKLDVIYGSSSGLKCDAFNVSSVQSCKPLQ